MHLRDIMFLHKKRMNSKVTFYYLQPEVLDYLETVRLVSMEKEIFPQIISDTGRFFGYEFQ
jgi:NDP-sugar pyrophosphorylase family protein